MRFWIQDWVRRLMKWLLGHYVRQLCAELEEILGVSVKRNGLNGELEFEGVKLKFLVSHDVLKEVVIRYWVTGNRSCLGRLEPENLNDAVASLLRVMGVRQG